jgi:hypothetical protein
MDSRTSKEPVLKFLGELMADFADRERFDKADLVGNAIDMIRGYAEPTHEPATGPVAPIARLRIVDDMIVTATMYAPGLPNGEHDVFPVPLNPNGQLVPSMFAEPLCPHGMPLAENICGPCSEGRPNRASQPPADELQALRHLAQWCWSYSAELEKDVLDNDQDVVETRDKMFAALDAPAIGLRPTLTKESE